MKNLDTITQEEKIIIGIHTLESFFDSLGPTDIYKQILLEELFKLITQEEEE